MKLLLIMLLLCPSLVLAQDYIVYENGRIVNVPPNKKAVIVDADAPRHLWTLGTKVKLRTPRGTTPSEAPTCANPGDLVISPGLPLCEPEPVPCEGLSLGGYCDP